MALTGAEQALMQCRSGLARSGATRSDYYLPNIAMTIGGVDVSGTSQLLKSTIELDLQVNQQPSKLIFMMRDGTVTPVEGQAVVLGLGAIGNRIFAGTILRKRRLQKRRVQATPRYELSTIDHGWLFDRRKFSARYTSQTVGAIATDIVNTYTSGFTTTNIAAGLATVDEIEFNDVYPSEAITRLVNLKDLLWYIDCNADVHVFSSETSQAPMDLSDTNTGFWDFDYERDLSQVRTRVKVEGAGSLCTASTAAGATSLPVSDTVHYSSSGGSVKSGPQIITYTGRSTTSGAGNLTGIPASGAGSILYTVNVDDTVNLWVVRNDAAAQTALATLEGGDGIHEHTIQDRRLSQTGAELRGDQDLALHKDVFERITYATKDKFTVPGKSVTVSLTGVLSGTYKIQRVVLSGFNRTNHVFPIRRVEATSKRDVTDLADVLRRIT